MKTYGRRARQNDADVRSMQRSWQQTIQGAFRTEDAWCFGSFLGERFVLLRGSRPPHPLTPLPRLPLPPEGKQPKTSRGRKAAAAASTPVAKAPPSPADDGAKSYAKTPTRPPMEDVCTTPPDPFSQEALRRNGWDQTNSPLAAFAASPDGVTASPSAGHSAAADENSNTGNRGPNNKLPSTAAMKSLGGGPTEEEEVSVGVSRAQPRADYTDYSPCSQGCCVLGSLQGCVPRQPTVIDPKVVWQPPTCSPPRQPPILAPPNTPPLSLG
jgi:hypothetical protein